MMYRWHTGFVAFLIHRFTGVLLSLYIFVHLYVLSHLKDPEEYKRLMSLMNSPLIRISEVALLALVIAHGLNGLRLTLFDLGLPSGYQKRLFWAALFLGIVLFALGSYPILIHGGPR